LCSSHCREIVDPVLFRHLTFHDDTEDSDQHITSIVHRLLEPNDTLRYSVRRLDIGPFQDDLLPLALHTSTIVQALNVFTNLQDFGWNVGYKIPSEVLATFHQRWPQCRLHVKQSTRFDATLDRDLIASQQLVTLEMPVFLDESSHPSQSEWQIMTQLVAGHNSLKVFRPFTQYARNITFGSTGKSQFHLLLDTKLPKLEDFRIATGYYADQLHATMLLEAISWSSLRRLDIGYAPTHITKGLIGLVPQLKSLSISFWFHPDNKFQCGSYNLLIELIESIQALEELSLMSSTSSLSEAEWLKIFHVHQHKLEIVKVGEIQTAWNWGTPLMIPGMPSLEYATLTLDRAVQWGNLFETTDSWVRMCSTECFRC
jgi:hypothetical protein